MSIKDAATRSHQDAASIHAWETGNGQPSIAQLRKLSETYKRPLAVFFLPEPPKGFDAQREFRRLPSVTPLTESPELRFALRLALYRREVAHDLYERLGEKIPALSVGLEPHEDPDAAGLRVRNLLGVSWESQLGFSSPYAALGAWKTAIERLGVLVFQTGDVELSEMRGTSITHGPLPVILVNNADAPHGRIFTLVHEFIHILFAHAGHRTSAMEGGRLPEDQVLERASNRIAAATLMPRDLFVTEISRYPEVASGDEEQLRRFSRRLNVSPEAILRRLVTLHKVSAALYRDKRQQWAKVVRAEKKPGMVPIEVRIVSAVGRPFASLVVEGYQRNAVSSADLVDHLGIQLKYLDKVVRQLVAGPGVAAVV